MSIQRAYLVVRVAQSGFLDHYCLRFECPADWVATQSRLAGIRMAQITGSNCALNDMEDGLVNGSIKHLRLRPEDLVRIGSGRCNGVPVSTRPYHVDHNPAEDYLLLSSTFGAAHHPLYQNHGTTHISVDEDARSWLGEQAGATNIPTARTIIRYGGQSRLFPVRTAQ